MYSLLLLSRGRNGANDSANAGRYLCRLCIDPMNNFSCDKVRGGVSASIGYVFLTNGVIPVDVILWPSHSHSRWANLHFVNFRDIFSRSSFFKIFSTVAIWSIAVPLVTTKISSMNACACGYSASMQSIARWNSAGIVVRPYNPVLNRYVPVERPPMRVKLHCTRFSY